MSAEDAVAVPRPHVEDLAHLLVHSPRTGALLRALSLSRGCGFPRNDGIWAVGASALLGEPILDSDVATALEQAAAHILVSLEFGQFAYRLANHHLVDVFRADPSHTSQERAVAWRLLRESRTLKPVPEYLRNWLPEHLSASDAWDRVRLSDLARMAPGPLGATLTRDVVGTEKLSPLLAATVAAANAHPDAGAEEWPQLLRAARRRHSHATSAPNHHRSSP
ncbi:MAG: hypothetical protein ABIS84_12030 [Arachnia sp.]